MKSLECLKPGQCPEGGISADKLNVELKKAPLNKDLVWVWAKSTIIQKVSGKIEAGLVKVRLVKGESPNGQKEFRLKGTESVSLIFAQFAQRTNNKKNKKR
ncbi:MAG: hypothetical protein ABIH63_04190 [archaeon]